MKQEYIIQMSFDTGKFMNFKFIMKLLEQFDLIEDGEIRLNFMQHFEYKKEEIVEKLQYVNFRKHCIILDTRNQDIEFQILSSEVTSFANLKIFGEMNENRIYEYINSLLSFFKDDFYMIHVLKLDEYDKKERFMQKFEFLKNKRYNLVNKFFPLHIYEDIGINIGLSRLMCFGKNMYKFISKDKLINNQYVYSSEEIDNVVLLKLYSSLNHQRNKRLERTVNKSLGIQKLENETRDLKYMDHSYGQYFLKGYEKYQSYYFYYDYITEIDNSKQYTIPMFYFDLVLKRYKNICFEFIEEDFGVGEIVGFFVYHKEDEAVSLKKVEDLEAYIMVEIFDISSGIDEYAKENGYTISTVKKNHYLFIKEDESTLDKFNYYILEDEKVYYKIGLKVRKDLLVEKEVKKIVSEYDKMIKSAKQKRW